MPSITDSPSLISQELRKKKRGEHVTGSKAILDNLEMDLTAKASPWLVSIFSYHVPDDMAEHETGSQIYVYKKNRGEEIIFRGSGIIVECEQLVGGKYSNIILTAASLFERTNGVLPHQVKVDVYLSDGKLFKGQVIACDFHYNLAAIRIVSYFPIQTATFKSLDDTLSIYPTHGLQLPGRSFQMPSNSNLFKIVPGTKIIRLVHSYQPAGRLSISSGVFSDTFKRTLLNCNELYWVKHANANDRCGGPVTNCSGEVIGIGFYRQPFLPANIVSRWWEHFKSCGQYRRPWLGVEVANLYSSNLEFLEHFMMKFPNISTGVVVAEVTQDSPASCSGIRPKDVIVECNGKVVSSKLQFFDVIWDMVGKSVEFNILRESTGEKLKLGLIVGDTTPDQFYKWRRPDWIAISKKQNMLTVTPDDFVCLRNLSLDYERRL
ncbi:putative protease Do-like 14 isoform X2 [Silene latifolia]|uniref:putative protease Do-like 14 isoform X2 n=1 Tax=Silene latifolia TaxID=37657 RepID=UPI003D77589E